MSVFSAFWGSYKGYLRPIMVYSVVSNLLILAPSIHMLQVYDRVLASGSYATLFYITIIVLGALCVYGVAEALRQRVAQRLSARYTIEVADKLFACISSAPNARSASGSYLRDYGTVRQFLSSKIFISFFDLPFIPVYLAILFMLHWLVGVIALIGICVMVAISLINRATSEPSLNVSRDAEAEAMGFAGNVFSKPEDIRSLGVLPNFISIWGQKTATSLIASDTSGQQIATFYALSKTFRMALQVLIMATGAFLVLQGNMSGGMIFMASMISGKALGPIEQVIGSGEVISKALAAYTKITSVVGLEPKLKARKPLPPPTGHIVANNLVYVPEGGKMDQRLVDRVSVNVRPGQVLGIAGPIGSGKSTLVRMLAGAVKPTAGEVLLDGAPHSQWPTEQWGRSIGYLSQEANLFVGTIFDNIARFDTDADKNLVYKAADDAGVHDMILGLPKGYSTLVGDGIFHLSQGQKQRIALARAFYGSPPLLILDEPNASLDQSSDQSLHKAILKAKNDNKAIIIVSQRAGIFELADHILEMKDGCAILKEIWPLRSSRTHSGYTPNTGQKAAEPQNRSAQMAPVQPENQAQAHMAAAADPSHAQGMGRPGSDFADKLARLQNMYQRGAAS